MVWLHQEELGHHRLCRPATRAAPTGCPGHEGSVSCPGARQISGLGRQVTAQGPILLLGEPGCH